MTTELTDNSSADLACCGAPVRHKSTRFGWDGDFEVVRALFVCEACGTQFLAEARQDVGPPTGASA